MKITFLQTLQHAAGKLSPILYVGLFAAAPEDDYHAGHGPRHSRATGQRALRYAPPRVALVAPHPDSLYRRRRFHRDSNARAHAALRSSRLAKRRASTLPGNAVSGLSGIA